MEYDESPRRPKIVFGEGLTAQMIFRKRKMNHQGIDGYDIFMNPSKWLVREYRLEEERKSNENGFIKRWYPNTMVNILRDDPYIGFTLIECNFDKTDSILSEKHIKYRKQVEQMQQIINADNVLIAKLIEQLRTRTPQIKSYTKMIQTAPKETNYDEMSETPTRR